MKWFLALLLVANFAHADIVMVDLNLSFKERDEAERAAENNHEKLVVIPEIPESARAFLTPMVEEAEKLHDLVTAAEEKKSPDLSALSSRYLQARQVIYAKLFELDPKMKEYADQYRKAQGNHLKPGMDPLDVGLGFKDYLRDTLLKMKDSGRTVTAEIFSGHAGQGDFMGEAGSLKKKDVFSILNDPELKIYTRSIKTLLLLGCYTLTAEESFTWRENVPNLALIAGFSGKAPRQNKPADLTYLFDAVTQADEVTDFGKPQSEEEITQHVLDSLAHFRNLSYLNAALFICGNYYYNGGKIEDLGTLYKKCLASDGKEDGDAVKALIEEYRSVYKKYYYAALPFQLNPPPIVDRSFEDVPPRPDDPANPLRKFYEDLQSISYCPNGSLQAMVDLRNPDFAMRVKRLLFFKDILRHYVGSNEQTLKRLNIDIGPSSSRSQVLEAIANFTEAHKGLSKSDQDFVKLLNSQLKDLDPELVPDNWID
jgi:hypothetical protein